ncbi:MAG: transcription elongation factor GreA, partial [Elusimicrobiaceae bacterium]|nr:transcription elongation factor GreA [Elusimicrobiaceae bacterium]
MSEVYYVSRKKYEALVNELKNLKELKASLSNEIGEAAAQGDLKENAEYHAARERQSFIEGRILELESALGRSQIVDVENLKGNKVVFGGTVEINDC